MRSSLRLGRKTVIREGPLPKTRTPNMAVVDPCRQERRKRSACEESLRMRFAFVRASARDSRSRLSWLGTRAARVQEAESLRHDQSQVLPRSPTEVGTGFRERFGSGPKVHGRLATQGGPSRRCSCASSAGPPEAGGKRARTRPSVWEAPVHVVAGWLAQACGYSNGRRLRSGQVVFVFGGAPDPGDLLESAPSVDPRQAEGWHRRLAGLPSPRRGIGARSGVLARKARCARQGVYRRPEARPEAVGGESSALGPHLVGARRLVGLVPAGAQAAWLVSGPNASIGS